MTEQERAFALNEWHLGSMNDGLFIIDTPPRPSTDEVHHDRKDGPTMVLNITDLPHEKAQAIVDAHNRALRLLAATPAASAEVRERVARVIERAQCQPEMTDAEFEEWWNHTAFVGQPFRVGRGRDQRFIEADAALSAIRPGDRLPAGVVTPEEPTEAMVEAGAASKLNLERAIDSLKPISLIDLAPNIADLYRREASIIIRAAIAAAKEAGR